MNSTATIPLRDVARLLAKLPGSRRSKIDDKALLSLLKSGQLKAGFHFPGCELRWISIPATYWAKVGTDKFRSIQVSDHDETKTGIYKVRFRQFANEYIESLASGYLKINTTKALNDLMMTELREVIIHGSASYEVVILEEEWTNYLKGNRLEEPRLGSKAKSGRKQKESWRDLAPIIGAYALAHGRKSKASMKVEESAKAIHAYAKKKGIPDLPAPDTIREIISQMHKEVEQLAADLNF
jgi:hypothetical protein